MHEIVTLQFGQRSNYLATHFWNTQESYFTYSEDEEALVDHDVHFRPGVGADGSDTFTPRTVIYDLKGGFGSLRKFNALYDIQADPSPAHVLWDGATTRQQDQSIAPSEYQEKLDLGLPTFQLHAADVRYWSDFNRVFYHPRSIVQLNEYELNSQLMPFENWSAGDELFQTLDKEFDLIDRDVRPFVEECDQMQGLQLMTGTDDAWGGFAAKYLDNLRDEYGKTCIWVWGIEDGTRTHKQLQRACNSARSLRAIETQASTYIRLASPPAIVPEYVNLEGTSDWLRSALLCTALESSTLPTRLRANPATKTSLSLLENVLNISGDQKVLELRASVNSPNHERRSDRPGDNRGVNGDSSRPSAEGHPEEGHDGPPEPSSNFDVNFSPRRVQQPLGSRLRPGHVFAQVESDRYLSPARRSTTAVAAEERLRRRLTDETVVEIFETSLTFPLLDTFPDTLFQLGRPQESLGVSAALVSSSQMKEQILDLRNETYRSIDLDEREALYNDLTQVANKYSFGWDSGSDSGEDS